MNQERLWIQMHERKVHYSISSLKEYKQLNGTLRLEKMIKQSWLKQESKPQYNPFIKTICD